MTWRYEPISFKRITVGIALGFTMLLCGIALATNHAAFQPRNAQRSQCVRVEDSHTIILLREIEGGHYVKDRVTLDTSSSPRIRDKMKRAQSDVDDSIWLQDTLGCPWRGYPGPSEIVDLQEWPLRAQMRGVLGGKMQVDLWARGSTPTLPGTSHINYHLHRRRIARVKK